MSEGRPGGDAGHDDLGLRAVERSFSAMQIDDEWSVREDRGFTWWGAWVRQRIWSDDAVHADGETLWHVRARTPAFRDLGDEPSTYGLLTQLNGFTSLSAYVYDPDDRTVSARCGVYLYDVVDEWLESYFVMAAALQASVAWIQVPNAADGRPLDDEPHPVSGPRRDPDDMLALAGSDGASRAPISRSMLRRAARTLAAENAAVMYDEERNALEALLPAGGEIPALWVITSIEHPVLGWGSLVRLAMPGRRGSLRAAWISNALNAAESADWRGEHRPYALGSWQLDGDHLIHAAFLPGKMIGKVGPEGVMILLRNLIVWGAVRAQFAAERLAWLDAAAASRYPEDEPPVDVGSEPKTAGGEGEASASGSPSGDDDDRPVPFAERSFGPESRAPRPRLPLVEPRAVRELVVDPSDPAAFTEIDDAVAVAEDGDRIHVRPGTYRKPVVVDRAVVIEGDGGLGTIVVEPTGGECLGVAASGAMISGLTIRPSRVANDGAAWSAIAVHDVAVTITGCSLTSHLGATVWIGGPSALATIRDCALTGGAQNAVWVVEEGRAAVIRCEIRGHRWPIVVGGPHASLRVEASTIVDNLDDGIAALGGAALTLEATEVRGNAGVGVAFYAAAPSSAVVDCRVIGNAGPAVVIRGGSGIRVVGNHISRNGAGVVVDEGASPTVERNEVAENADVGIGVIGDMTNPYVSDNTISSRRPSGIVVRQGASGTFERNRLTAGDVAGIWVADEATCPTFRANVVTGGDGVAVSISAGAGGLFESNDLRGNAGGSWEIESAGELRRSGNLEDTGRESGGPHQDRDEPAPNGPSMLN